MTSDRLLRHFNFLAEAPDVIPRMRRFILDLAVRGKLVGQDPAEESATQLLDRIRAERRRLMNDGITAKQKPLSALADEEIPFDAPIGWKWVRIREITADRGQKIPNQDFTYIDVTAINKEVGCIADPRVLSASEAPSRARKVVRAGDVIYSCVRPYLLNVAIVDQDFIPAPITSTAFAILDGFGLTHAKYLWIVLRSPFMVECVETKMRGQAYPAINDSDFALLPVPLPPLAEQHRIVTKVEELMALCDRFDAARATRERTRDRLVTASLHRLNEPSAAEETGSSEAAHDNVRFVLDHLPRLTTRPAHIKQLRETILKLAVRGLLVPQVPEDEHASKLLGRIRAELTRLVSTGKIRKVVPLPSIDYGQAPFELPPGWCWARFSELGIFGRGKSKHRPRNDQTLFENGSHLLIQTGDVARSNGLITTYTNKYNDLGLAQSMKWPKGTLCITIAANIADSGLLSVDACFPDSVVGFSPASELGSARYFEYFVRTAKEELSAFAPSTAQKNINLDTLNAVMIPIPPLAEQRQIVAKVDELMGLCDQIDARLQATAKGGTRLLDALLHEALIPSELGVLQVIA